MTTEYSSLKVPELKKLLSEKGLSQTGNKADLVARLNEHDKAAAAPEEPQPAPEEPKQPEPAKEDEISYSDEDAPANAAPAAEPKTEDKPADAGEKPAEEEAAPAAPEAEAPPPTSYAMGLASTEADAEAKKREERAKRFGIEEEDDAKKRADRAKRFGIDEKELASGLDSALPERPLKRGRGRDGADGGRPGKRQSMDRRGGGRRRGGGGGHGNGAEPKRTGIMDDPTEKAKAEKRAARFAAA